LPTILRVALVAAVASLTVPASAPAADGSSGTGGAQAQGSPRIGQAVCEDAAKWECARGARLTLEGEALADVRLVRFVGGRGRKDDRVVRPRRTASHAVEVLVPRTARSGPIAVTSSRGRRALSPKRLRVRARSAARRPQSAGTSAPAGSAGVFPVMGAFDYGTSVNRFGGGRGHKGQDVFAKCGTPLVAVYDAKVQFVATQDRAGNYVVLQDADGQSYAYMHMQAPAEVKRGDAVRAGQRVGRVGETGRASGCHLHFEQWTAPGWYEGGRAIDPLPLLQRLAR
jgi:murein DD-endopeptidase MepM/ murein hydrolase activator NlpD